jgi:PAS domain S-box-containing protein
MSTFPHLRQAFATLVRPPLWFRLSSASLLLFSTALLISSFVPDIYRSRYTAFLIPLLLISIAFGLCLFGAYLRAIWRKQNASNRVSDALVRKLASVFEHVLDGILILNDEGICLEGNPAACDILRVSRQSLLGRSFAQFYSDSHGFTKKWKVGLECGCQRGHAELRRFDGQKVYVNYALAANYMPGQHILVLCNTTERLSAESAARESEDRFKEIAENIQEIFWMIDAHKKEVLFVTPAYEAVTGYSRAALFANRVSYQQIIHSEDRERVLSKLNEAPATGQFDQEFRIVRADGSTRWMWAKMSDKPEPLRNPRWLVGFALDVTDRKRAEFEAHQHLVAAEAAHAETEALRRATLALTQNLSMDSVLDALLACLLDLVPYDTAAVILADDDTHLFVGRDYPRVSGVKTVTTLKATDTALLQRVLIERKSVSVPDTSKEPDWREIKPLTGNRCWMGVPLMTANGMFGLLSVGAAAPRKFTAEHLRLAKSLAVPAAAAIYNARLYEYAMIYSSELEVHIAKLKEAQKSPQ